MIYYIGACVAVIIFIIVWYLIRRKHINAVSKHLDELNVKHKKLLEEIEIDQHMYDDLSKKISDSKVKLAQLDSERAVNIQRAREAKEATERLLAAEHERAAAELKGVRELEEERIKNEIKEKERILEEQYNFKKQQFTEDFETMMDVYSSELQCAREEVNDFQARRAAINEAIMREKEIAEHDSFYSLNIPQNDREDIAVLQSMDLRLHNRDVIPKLIWELFIRRPAQEMIKRVTGGKKVGGIYKITYKKTNEAYIGKTTDFATRWQNHLKTAIGLEGAAKATLHSRLAQDGLWNYTFEILEIVDKDHLSARESYYIDLYGTKQQLNMKSGDKQ